MTLEQSADKADSKTCGGNAATADSRTPRQATPLIYLNELHVLLDAAIGSMKIRDAGSIWCYDGKTRKDIVDLILKRMGKIGLPVSSFDNVECEQEENQ